MGERGPVSWYAVYTRFRHEKMAAEQLWQKEIECFLPLSEVLSKWKDRRKRVQLPLFPGYLFVNTNILDRRLDILKVPSVVRIIGFDGQSALIPEAQIHSLKRLVFSTLPYDPYPYLNDGDPVRIIRGPLRGLEGKLVEKRNGYRFILAIDLIHQSACCEIQACDVERIL